MKITEYGPFSGDETATITVGGRDNMIDKPMVLMLLKLFQEKARASHLMFQHHTDAVIGKQSFAQHAAWREAAELLRLAAGIPFHGDSDEEGEV